MRASQRSAVDPFIVMEVMDAAHRAEAEGRRIIHMEIGQPATPAPSGARAALVRAMEAGPLGYRVAGDPCAQSLTQKFSLPSNALR